MKNTAKSYILILFLIIFGIVKYVFLDKIYNPSTVSIIVTIFWILLCFATLVIFKYPKDRSINNKMSIKVVLISLLSSVLIAYLLGFFVGFMRNPYSFTIKNIIRNILPILILCVTKEVIRYILAKNSIYNRKPIILFTISVIIVDILCNMISTYNAEVIFKFSATFVIPTIAAEMLCSYLLYNFDIRSSLIYMIATNIYIYLLPIIPDLGDFANAVMFTLLPFIIYFIVGRVVKYNKKEKENNFKFDLKLLFTIPILIFLIVIVILVSGVFNYKLIAVASNSMNPQFKRGDGVIYHKTKDITIDDVIAFNKEAKIITHRVVAIKTVNGKEYIYTKGDNNNAVDDSYITKDDVLGVVKYVVSNIGYPTIWFNEELKGE